MLSPLLIKSVVELEKSLCDCPPEMYKIRIKFMLIKECVISRYMRRDTLGLDQYAASLFCFNVFTKVFIKLCSIKYNYIIYNTINWCTNTRIDTPLSNLKP